MWREDPNHLMTSLVAILQGLQQGQAPSRRQQIEGIDPAVGDMVARGFDPIEPAPPVRGDKVMTVRPAVGGGVPPIAASLQQPRRDFQFQQRPDNPFRKYIDSFDRKVGAMMTPSAQSGLAGTPQAPAPASPPVRGENPFRRDVDRFDEMVEGLTSAPLPAKKAQPRSARRSLQAALSGRPRVAPLSRARIEATTDRPRSVEGAAPYRPTPDSLPIGDWGEDDVMKVLGSIPQSSVPSLQQQGADLSLPAHRDRVARGGWKGTLMSALKGALAGAAQGLRYSEGDLRGALGGAITGSVGSAISPERGRSYYWEQVEQPRLDQLATQDQARQAGVLELALKQAQTETAGYGPQKARTDIALDEERTLSERENRAFTQSERKARAAAAQAQAERDKWINIPGTGVLFNIETGKEVRAPYGRQQALSADEAEFLQEQIDGSVEDIARRDVEQAPDGWRRFVSPEQLKIYDDERKADLYDPAQIIAADRAVMAAQKRQLDEALRRARSERQRKVRERRFGKGGGGEMRSHGSLNWD